MQGSFTTQARSWGDAEVKRGREPTLKRFIQWLAEHCQVVPGDVMDYSEYLEVAKVFGASPDDIDRALESSSWP